MAPEHTSGNSWQPPPVQKARRHLRVTSCGCNETNVHCTRPRQWPRATRKENQKSQPGVERRCTKIGRRKGRSTNSATPRSAPSRGRKGPTVALLHAASTTGTAGRKTSNDIRQRAAALGRECRCATCTRDMQGMAEPAAERSKKAQERRASRVVCQDVRTCD